MISFDLGAPNTAFHLSKRLYFESCLQKRDRAVRRVQNGCGRKVGEVEIVQMGPPLLWNMMGTPWLTQESVKIRLLCFR